MEYEIKNEKNATILRLSKPITVYQLQKLKDAFQDCKTKLNHKKNVIVDLGGVPFLDALALGILVSFSKELRDGGGDIKLAHVNDDIKNVFELSHLSKVYESFDSVDAASKSFSWTQKVNLHNSI